MPLRGCRPREVSRRWRLGLLAALGALAIALSACGGSHAPRRAAGEATAALRRDIWNPPQAFGPPSTAKFCKLLVYQYEHLGELPFAASLKIKEQIVGDYISFTPTVIAAAPPQIAPAAKTYLDSVAEILADLRRVGLQAAKLPRGTLGPLLLAPAIRSAAQQVLDFSQQQCHYTIS
jgi:hypothetical protein